jgi:uncharacterized protein YjiK
MIKTFCLFLFFFSTFLGCDGDPSKDSTSTENTSKAIVGTSISLRPDHTFYYDLDHPDHTLKLDNELKEISGLGIDATGKYLYAVQDEEGKIYMLDIKDGDIKATTKFHKDGDYEGIEVVDNRIYVVKSTGTLYEVTNVGGPNQRLQKYNSFLSRENDVEGLAFNAEQNCLLLACKGLPATGESFDEIRYKKTVYKFDLATNTLSPDPMYTLQLDHIRAYLELHPAIKKYEKLLEFFSAGKENLTFNPSAIAIHPITKDIYLTSSVGKVLIVLNPDGNVVHIEKLDKDVHVQPEGIAFATDGTLYISNEGKGNKARIHRFAYKKN